MSTELKLRRGTELQHSTFVGSNGEITVNTTNKTLHVHDGVNEGGFELVQRAALGVAGSSIPISNVPAYVIATRASEARNILDGGVIIGDVDANASINTPNIQSYLDDAGVIVFPEGTIVTGPLFVRSNTVIRLHPKTVIKAKSGLIWSDRLISMTDVENVLIFGNKATVRMLKDEYTTGEDRHGVAMFGANKNIGISDLTVKDTGGDCFYVQGNATLIDCVGDNGRRNGLSVITGSGKITVRGGCYKNTSGTDPQAGIDIEPNNAGDIVDVDIYGVETSGNARCGISVVPFHTTNPVSVNISNWTSRNDGSNGNGRALLFALTPPSHYIRGQINVTDSTIINPKNNGVEFVQWTERCPRIKMRNVNVINPGAVAQVSNSTNAGFIQSSSSDAGVSQGNFELIDCSAIDDRAVPLMRVACFIQAQHMNQRSIKIVNFRQSGQTAGFTTPVTIGSAFALDNVLVEYDRPRVQAQAVTKTIGRSDFNHIETNSAQANHTVNLPLASSNNGLEVYFRVDIAGFIRVIPNVADKILAYTTGTGISLISYEVGSLLKLTAKGTNGWQVETIIGTWAALP